MLTKDFEPYYTIQKSNELWIIPVAASLGYLIGIWQLQKFINPRKPYDLKVIFGLWNLLLSVFSTIGAYKTLPALAESLVYHGFESSICNQTLFWGTGESGFWVMLFIYSKIPELLDTVFIVLRKKKLLFLHWYHHVSVLLYCWHSYATMSPSGIYFVAMNYTVHSVMYFYYFLTCFGLLPANFPTFLITLGQILQMLIGTLICISSWFYNDCFTNNANLVFGALLYASYFVLFAQFALKRYGAQAIVKDEFSKCFAQRPRNNYLSLDVFVRYLILFPIRLVWIGFASFVFIVLLPLAAPLAFLLSWGARITYHFDKPHLQEPHVFVANHTSIIDYAVLSAHGRPHATIAQKHRGFLGLLINTLLSLNGSLAIDRNDKKSRQDSALEVKQHIQKSQNAPFLIFPEGTCVNNEYTVLFHKGAFELDAIICPVAIKYDKRFSDAYWHSRSQSFTFHLFYLMTRWTLVAHVWYLPPRRIAPNQTSIEFANQVKAEISKTANLKNLSWDGYFKNYAPPKEKQNKLKQIPRKRYVAVILKRLEAKPEKKKRRNSLDPQELLHSSFQTSSYTQPTWCDPNDEQANITRNKILVALHDTNAPSYMIQKVSDRRNDVVSTWKQVKRHRFVDEEDVEIANRRIEYSAWRVWFKQKLKAEAKQKEDKLKAEAKQKEDDQPILSRVSSYLSTTSFFANTDTQELIVKRTKSFGDLLEEFGFSSNNKSPQELRARKLPVIV